MIPTTQKRSLKGFISKTLLVLVLMVPALFLIVSVNVFFSLEIFVNAQNYKVIFIIYWLATATFTLLVSFIAFRFLKKSELKGFFKKKLLSKLGIIFLLIVVSALWWYLLAGLTFPALRDGLALSKSNVVCQLRQSGGRGRGITGNYFYVFVENADKQITRIRSSFENYDQISKVYSDKGCEAIPANIYFEPVLRFLIYIN